MTENSKIEWTDHTMNFWIGCQEVSGACDLCYAREQNRYFGWVDGWGPHGQRRRTQPQNWNKALAWNKRAGEAGKPEFVFTNSLSDFFDKAVDDLGYRDAAWDLIDECRNLIWLILTKRPQNIHNRLPAGWMRNGKPWPHVWFGITTENQEEAERRIPRLLAVPAAKYFLSCEPLLGPLDLTTAEGWLWRYGGRLREPVNGWPDHAKRQGGGIDWVIAGGESDPMKQGRARPANPQWFRSLRDQCEAADVPFFFKQWGDWVSVSEVEGPADKHHVFPDGRTVRHVGKKHAGATLDHEEWKEVPAYG